MTTRPVIIPWDKRETPPNAVTEAEDGIAVLVLALSTTPVGVTPSKSQESQFSEFWWRHMTGPYQRKMCHTLMPKGE